MSKRLEIIALHSNMYTSSLTFTNYWDYQKYSRVVSYQDPPLIHLHLNKDCCGWVVIASGWESESPGFEQRQVQATFDPHRFLTIHDLDCNLLLINTIFTIVLVMVAGKKFLTQVGSGQPLMV